MRSIYGAECSECGIWVQSPVTKPIAAIRALREAHEELGRDGDKCQEGWWIVEVGTGANPDHPGVLGERRWQPMKGDVSGERTRRP